MFNEVKKYIFTIVIMSALMHSCGNSTSNQLNKDSIAAEDVLKRANMAFDCEENEKALALIDTIDSIYSKQINVRRKAMSLRPKVMERLIFKEIIATDSMIALEIETNDSLNQLNKLRIKKEKLERQLQVARNQQVRLGE